MPEGTRLREDWIPAPELLLWAMARRPDLNVAEEVEKFRDHWLARSGAIARKCDWNAAFRNWVRKAYAQAPKGVSGAMRLEAMKRGLVADGNPDGATKALVPQIGQLSFLR